MNQRTALAAVAALFLVVTACGPAEEAPPYDEGLPGDSRVPGSLPLHPIAARSVYEGPETPVTEPPVQEPPVEEPPVEEPPVEEPPVEGPPAEEPPVEEPPVEEPPVDEGPVVAPPSADCAFVRVTGTGGVTLNVRPDPSTAGAPVGALNPGEVVDVLGVVAEGQDVNGTTTWFEIDGGSVEGFVSGAFTQCHDPDAYVPGFFLPLACGTSTTISQGNNSSFSHNGRSRYAFDFSLPRGTPLVAIDDGIVAFADGSTDPGEACWSGGGQSCIGEANYIVVEHADGSQSMYAHLNDPSLSVGDVVLRGEQVGLSGGTGWSTGPHAHVARIGGCGTPWCDSIPLSFEDVDGDGVPATGETVTSNNCP